MSRSRPQNHFNKLPTMALPFSLVSTWHRFKGLDSEGLLVALLHHGQIRPNFCLEPAVGLQAELNAAMGAQLSQLPLENVVTLDPEVKVYIATNIGSVLNKEWWPKAGVTLAAAVHKCHPGTAMALISNRISMEEVGLFLGRRLKP